MAQSVLIAFASASVNRGTRMCIIWLCLFGWGSLNSSIMIGMLCIQGLDFFFHDRVSVVLAVLKLVV